MRTLLAITTANQLEFNEAAVASILECKLTGVDLCIIDDCSTDGTPELFKKMGLRVISKDKSKGLTHSWNIAYRLFKDEKYDALILANNDILVPKGAIGELIKCLDQEVIVGALSTDKGVGHQQEQAIRNHFPLQIDEMQPENYQAVQDELIGFEISNTLHEIQYINGFFFGVNREIINYEFDSEHLFDPNNVNVGNEDDLCSRMPDRKKYVCLNCFVFHFKGVTFELSNIDKQDYDGNVNRNMLWSKAEELQESTTKRLIYKLRRKLSN